MEKMVLENKQESAFWLLFKNTHNVYALENI